MQHRSGGIECTGCAPGTHFFANHLTLSQPADYYGYFSSSCTPSLIFGPYTWLPANMLIPRWLMSTNVNTNVNATKLIAHDNIKLDNTITHVFLRPTFPQWVCLLNKRLQILILTKSQSKNCESRKWLDFSKSWSKNGEKIGII